MDLFNTISCAVAAAYEAVANRNRQAAVNNRLKAVVRSELATINRAYIALGKHFYNDLRSQAAGDEACFGVIQEEKIVPQGVANSAAKATCAASSSAC